MPKFKLDENLPQEAADLLRNAGYDAATIWDQQMVEPRIQKSRPSVRMKTASW
jgi:predicted nuclease of predicted toxin-antitoxin system